MQLISLEKKKINAVGPTGADREKINQLLTTARQYSRFEVEVGCGNGHFLSAYLKKHTNRFFTAIEMKHGRCLKVLKKIENQGLTQAWVIEGRAENLISCLPEGVVDRYHIYFPDPWPKTKHKKRRFLRWPRLEELWRTLKPGGTIFFVSDIFDYYLQTKTLFLLHPGMVVHDMQAPDEIFCSLFANRFAELGKQAYFIAGRKIATEE